MAERTALEEGRAAGGEKGDTVKPREDAATDEGAMAAASPEEARAAATNVVGVAEDIVRV
jgi:hypothetical protein